MQKAAAANVGQIELEHHYIEESSTPERLVSLNSYIALNTAVLPSDVNQFKKALEQRRKSDHYLHYTGGLWRKECARLKNELLDALIRAEGIPPEFVL